jgi:hypothetical protein
MSSSASHSAERDDELNRHKAAGLPGSQIAALLHTTRGAVLGRSNRLRHGALKSDFERAMKRIAAAEKRKKERTHQDNIFAAMRADLAAGIDLNIVIKRTLSAGIKRNTVAEVLGLSRAQVYKVARLGRVLPRWTSEQVKLFVSMRPNHSAKEIADALGTTRGTVLGKIWRMDCASEDPKIAQGRRKIPNRAHLTESACGTLDPLDCGSGRRVAHRHLTSSSTDAPDLG